MATREELRLNPALRKGMSYQQLVAAGMSPTEAGTVAAGFTGAFTGGAAEQFRQQKGLTVDATGNVKPVTAPTVVTNPERSASALALLNNPAARAGMSYSQLKAAGLTDAEAGTIQAGYTGAFGGGAADDWRKSQGITLDATGNVVTPQTPQQQLTSQVTNPVVPAAGVRVPTLQTVQANEIQQTPAPLSTITAQAPASVANTVAPVTATQATAPVPVDANAITSTINPTLGQYTPSLTEDVGTLTPEQMSVAPLATVRGQLESLMDFEGTTPMWAKGAVIAAQELLASRGIGASSIGAAAIYAAIEQSALPIASADANTYFQTDIKNFDSRQQASLVNFQTKQQNMLTDVAAQNAAKNFNASSAQQTQQFVAGLVTDIEKFNTNLTATMEQLNVQEKNKVALANAGNTLEAAKVDSQIQATLSQFNAQQEAQRQQFNANMQYVIDQANVTWQRSVNTQNTAAINAAAMGNAQNAFNLSASALNNLWQAQQDALSWIMQSTESQKDRDYNMAMAANNYNYNSSLNEDIGPAIGQVATAVLIDWLTG